MNQFVFNTEMVMLTFATIIIQGISLLIHLGVTIVKPYNRTNWRFMTLIILFLSYNISTGLFIDSQYNIPVFTQSIIANLCSLLLVAYFYYFLINELEIKQRKYYNVKFLATSVLTLFFTVFVSTYLISDDLFTARRLFTFTTVPIALFFCINTIKSISAIRATSPDEGPYKRLHIAGNFGIAFMSTLPIVAAVGKYQLINNALVNLSFILIWFAYYSLLVFQARAEKTSINNDKPEKKNKELFYDIKLTPRELEVANYILLKMNYTEVAEVMFITNKTVSKHASNIFKKVNCNSREDFLNTYKTHKIIDNFTQNKNT